MIDDFASESTDTAVWSINPEHEPALKVHQIDSDLCMLNFQAIGSIAVQTLNTWERLKQADPAEYFYF